MCPGSPHAGLGASHAEVVSSAVNTLRLEQGLALVSAAPPSGAVNASGSAMPGVASRVL